jgi:hypothetical protein
MKNMAKNIPKPINPRPIKELKLNDGIGYIRVIFD